MNFKRLSDACEHRKHVRLDYEGRITEYQCTHMDTTAIDEQFCDQDGEFKEPWDKNQTAWIKAFNKLSESSHFKCCERKCPLLKD